MVSSGVLEYGRPGYFLNNDTIGLGIKVKPERHKLDFTINLSWYWETNMYDGISTRSLSKSNPYQGGVINC